MKILITGGGTGGHVFPAIAIAEELNKIADQEKILDFHIYYMSDTPYDAQAWKREFVTFIPITSGKLRVYFSLKNILDIFKTGVGMLQALWKVFSLYPDVVISKGGYPAFPVLFAARIFRIPVIIHESDTVPGRVSRWSGKFAKRIALTFPEAATYFDEKKVSVVGQPIRHAVANVSPDGAAEFFDLDPHIPIVGVIGGSQGAQVINNCITELLPQLLEKYQVIHQTGTANFEDVKTDAHVVLGDSMRRTRYKVFPFLNELQTKMFGGASTIVVSRAGSMLNEIAAWGKPSILIPYAIAHDDHQRKNAYHYARTGACEVIEESNLTASVLMNQIDMILTHKERYDSMATRAKAFYKPDAARTIAAEAIKIALEHEK
jgi:UDP-N-acetylglucosamine--N-acetylmuramyl-(pentapeptide) pyrophosphoryl-undecaprenol N-acetylglucosamine transferase